MSILKKLLIGVASISMVYAVERNELYNTDTFNPRSPLNVDLVSIYNETVLPQKRIQPEDIACTFEQWKIHELLPYQKRYRLIKLAKTMEDLHERIEFMKTIMYESYCVYFEQDVVAYMNKYSDERVNSFNGISDRLFFYYFNEDHFLRIINEYKNDMKVQYCSNIDEALLNGVYGRHPLFNQYIAESGPVVFEDKITQRYLPYIQRAIKRAKIKSKQI